MRIEHEELKKKRHSTAETQRTQSSERRDFGREAPLDKTSSPKLGVLSASGGEIALVRV
jgi:hypothetical protein